ncbi:response regulator transcription factor [Tissierella sp. Yu-01]|uniref:response regulator n=1 Tax=Tissierella sp. Yu-01 TaxID=3035694 RepID=UPI00240DD4DC|nr:response regulator transcription factor [Tissierella sp. Yu-01]WFA08273.1 response regulator transcription factor [Tissierella sp. Yu-01]
MKILVVDDHPLVRKGVSSTLSFEEETEKIFEASNIQEAISLINSEKPELIIVDLYLGNEDGLEIVRRAKSKNSNAKFMVLTSSLKKEDFLRSEEVGVDGYILKEAFAEDILYAVRVVLRGKKFIDPEILKHQSSHSQKNNRLSELTPRENDVLVALGKGLSNQEIAEELFISEHTVKKHISNILSKLELSHRTQAALLVNEASNLYRECV